MEKEILQKNINPIDWLDGILADGIAAGASDIHFDSLPDIIEVRFRIDGILHLADTFPVSLLETILARLRVMAQISGTEYRPPEEVLRVASM